MVDGQESYVTRLQDATGRVEDQDQEHINTTPTR